MLIFRIHLTHRRYNFFFSLSLRLIKAFKEQKSFAITRIIIIIVYTASTKRVSVPRKHTQTHVIKL